jgi:hypothetical protein
VKWWPVHTADYVPRRRTHDARGLARALERCSGCVLLVNDRCTRYAARECGPLTVRQPQISHAVRAPDHLCRLIYKPSNARLVPDDHARRR